MSARWPHQVLGDRRVQSTTVVAGANVRGPIPARPWRRSEAATVLRDTVGGCQGGSEADEQEIEAAVEFGGAVVAA